jgi:hypothetical protein
MSLSLCQWSRVGKEDARIFLNTGPLFPFSISAIHYLPPMVADSLSVSFNAYFKYAFINIKNMKF